MNYLFSEKILGPSFREDILSQIKLAIASGSSFNIIGMPFIGISPFFRYLAMTDFAYMIYIDIHALLHRTKDELYMSLYRELGGKGDIVPFDAYNECKKMLSIILKKESKVLIMINRFDYLEKKEFSNGIFTTLKSLEDMHKGRIIFGVASSVPLYAIDENAIVDSNMAFFSKIIYFTPYKGRDLEKLLLVSPVGLKPNTEDITKALRLSGGHATLLQVLIKTEYLDTPFTDPFLKLHLKLIYDTCNTQQKNMLYKLAIGKNIKSIDHFLLKMGIVKEFGQEYELFSPLFKQYLISYIRLKLTKKERLLFSLLKKHLGRTVYKEKLFQTVWRNNQQYTTDWALNSLIYRLRRNPTINNKYIIENDKDIGYRMTKV